MRRLLAAGLAVAAALLVSAAPAGATPGPASSPEYWFDNWKLPLLWAAGDRGQGVTIAEIDTGVNAKLPELAANVLPGTDFGHAGNGQVDREINPFGHGTAMASIMVGKKGLLGITGIAPAAKILPIAVPLKGTTDSSADDHLADAIRWAADNGGKVISMSLGGERLPGHHNVPCPTDEQSAIYYALSKGAVLLAASGNTGQSGSQVEEPGVCLGVISVGAVGPSGKVASFSSRHPYLTLTAPGVGVPSLGRIKGSAYTGDGTSQATAIASAVVALEWSKFPKLSGEEIVTRLLATLDRHGSGHSSAYGYGSLNAYRALTESVPISANNPVYAAVTPFLARFEKLADTSGQHAVLPVPPAKTYGAFSVGRAPRLVAPATVRALVVTAVGLLALLALAVLGTVRSRARRVAARSVGAAAAPGWPALGDAPSVPAEPMPPPATDASGVIWREITAPPHREPGSQTPFT